MKVGDVVTVDAYPTRIPVFVREIEGDRVHVAIPHDVETERTIPYRRDEVSPLLSLVPAPTGSGT